MKAIIMAGGEGARLWPISAGLPKPMAPVLGRPALHGTVELLKKHGIRDICMTLRTLPAVIMDYFGDGSSFGVHIEYRLETQPLGTAGGVGACRDFVGAEDVLVLSGDGVCTFDLTALMAYHREKGAAATLALCRREDPTEYGICLTAADGRITGFREKPRWEEVVTDLVNTGLYVLSPAVLERIPQGQPCDFGKTLFPALLREGLPLYGWEAEGYWCDIGSPAAYRGCCLALAQGGLVAEEALTAPTARVSGSVLTGGTVVEGQATVTDSVLHGARVRRGAVISRSVLCEGAVVGDGAYLLDGVVLGAKARVGAGAVLYPGVRVGPGAEVPPGAFLRHDLPGGEAGGLTVQEALRIGALLGQRGSCTVGWQGGNAAASLAQALSSGVRSAGAVSIAADSAFEAVHACLCPLLSEGRGVFLREAEGEVSLTFFGGEPRGQVRYLPAERFGALSSFRGSGRVYLSKLVELGGGEGALSGQRARAEGLGQENAALRQALAILGVTSAPEAAAFTVLPGGLAVVCRDEAGVFHRPERLGRLTEGANGAEGAILLLQRCQAAGTSLHSLLAALPPVTHAERRVQVQAAASRMRELQTAFATELTPTGIRLHTPEATATVSPTPDGKALLLQAEAPEQDAAERLLAAIRAYTE